mmetsp:Transcript_14408/g.43097  ORF Transcript_14408/g.43097 Transcript_14408/m.43097 type:complete len:204 (+) Transcript_14408:350-961(+)
MSGSHGMLVSESCSSSPTSSLITFSFTVSIPLWTRSSGCSSRICVRMRTGCGSSLKISSWPMKVIASPSPLRRSSTSWKTTIMQFRYSLLSNIFGRNAMLTARFSSMRSTSTASCSSPTALFRRWAAATRGSGFAATVKRESVMACGFTTRVWPQMWAWSRERMDCWKEKTMSLATSTQSFFWKAIGRPGICLRRPSSTMRPT